MNSTVARYMTPNQPIERTAEAAAHRAVPLGDGDTGWRTEKPQRRRHMPIIGEIRSFGFGTGAAVDSDFEFYQRVLRPQGWLECDGKSLPIPQFKRLFLVIGQNWGSEDRPNTFKLPDLRGLFIRGWNHGSGRDPDAGSRLGIHPVDAPGDFGGATGDAVGSYQEDAFRRHWHELSYRRHGLKNGEGELNLEKGGTPVKTEPAGGDETRPKNTFLMYCIWTGRQLPPQDHDLTLLDPDVGFDG